MLTLRPIVPPQVQGYWPYTSYYTFTLADADTRDLAQPAANDTEN